MSSHFQSTGTFDDFWILLAFDTFIFIGALVLFKIFSQLPSNRSFYYPKLYADGTNEKPTLPQGYFGWIKDCLHLPDEKIFERCGLDSLMHIVFLRLVCYMIVSFLPFALVIIIINGTGDQNVTGVPKLSLANIAGDSPRMWIHLTFSYAFTIITLYWLYKGYQIYEKFRIIENSRDLAHNYTVLIRDVPPHVNLEKVLLNIASNGTYITPTGENLTPGEPVDTIKPNGFDVVPLGNEEKYVGTGLVSLHWAVDAKMARKLQEEKRNIFKKLRFAQEHFEKTGKVPYHKVGKFWNLQRVESIPTYQKKLQDLDAEINRLRNNLFGTTSSGFATFQSIGMAFQCAQTLIHDDPRTLPKPAPYVIDILWDNLRVPKKRRLLMTCVSFLAFFGLLFFWAIPVGFVQALANLNRLGQVPGLEFLAKTNNWPTVVRAFIQGFLPSLVLIIFYALLPKIIVYVSLLQSPHSTSKLEEICTQAFFMFEFINVLLVSALSGGIFNILYTFSGDLGASEIANLLGSTIPAQSIFFINLILTYALVTCPVHALRFPELVMTKIKQFLTGSEGEKKEAEKPNPPYYFSLYGVELLVFSITMTYVFTSPFVILWAFLFFAITYVYTINYIIYVGVPKVQGKGNLWPIVVNCCLISLIFAQITLIGVLSLKGFPEGAAVSPMLFLSIAFAFWIHKHFRHSCDYLPASKYPSNTEFLGFKYKDSYLDPALDSRRELPDGDWSLSNFLEAGYTVIRSISRP
eukprot:TRINITY_DN6012_c0_g1_i1.p1 TRINITY_DN6012_c0_g1~~TRINITY_DN6012_c0_g1_i1.p1  ORF type:complete len:746 (+),score=105.70 TRINITY_DN6012_c0_g1_i1:271-2508(+)